MAQWKTKQLGELEMKIPSPSSLCLVCENRKTSESLVHYHHTRTLTFGKLENSAQSGCNVCAAILRGIQMWIKSPDVFAGITKIKWCNHAKDTPRPLVIEITGLDSGGNDKSFQKWSSDTNFNVFLRMYTHKGWYRTPKR